MELNPFTALSHFVLGWIKEGHVQAWIRLGVSLLGTGLVTFVGMFGITGLLTFKDFGAAGSFMIALYTACIVTSTTLLFLWRRTKLTKGIPIAVPGEIEHALNEQLLKQGMVLSGEDKK